MLSTQRAHRKSSMKTNARAHTDYYYRYLLLLLGGGGVHTLYTMRHVIFRRLVYFYFSLSLFLRDRKPHINCKYSICFFSISVCLSFLVERHGRKEKPRWMAARARCNRTLYPELVFFTFLLLFIYPPFFYSLLFVAHTSTRRPSSATQTRRSHWPSTVTGRHVAEIIFLQPNLHFITIYL